jgi:hypothetical protein
MDTPTRTDPPYVPIRTGRWASHQKTPRWLWLAGALVLAGAVLVGLVHKPSQNQLAGDMKAFLTEVRTGTQSCAGGVSESLTALRGIGTGAGAADRAAATVKIANTGAANCEPANSEPIDDFSQYQVTESLAAFHLDTTVNDLVTWCFPYAMRVQFDVAGEAGAHQAATRQRYAAALSRDRAALNAERAKIDKILLNAIHSTGVSASLLPRLPS